VNIFISPVFLVSLRIWIISLLGFYCYRFI